MAEVNLSIDTKAAQPKQASGDGHSVSSHSLSELIKAEKHLAAKQAAARPFGGIRMSRVRLPGSTGTS